MKTSSCKAKGRRLQDLVRQELRRIGAQYGLVDDDIKAAQMGAFGEDIVLSPAARKILDLWVECKNVEKLNVVGVFEKHREKYEPKGGIVLLVHSKNRTKPMVTLALADFLPLYEARLREKENGKNGISV
jgi:hypothetical protein